MTGQARAELGLDLRDHASQGVAVIGVAGKRLGVGDERTALRAMERRGERDLDAELVRKMSFALADALDLGRVQRIAASPSWPSTTLRYPGSASGADPSVIKGSLRAFVKASCAAKRAFVGKSYSEFREEFDRHIAHFDTDNAALPWDRLGHWAQDDEDWAEAERCFRKAYELAGGDYGYCLAIALKS
jgi:hypothetical protein